MSRYTQRLIEQLDKRNQAKLDKVPYIYGILGANIDGQDRVEVPGRPGYVYARIRDNLSDLAQVYNDAVSPVYGLPVIIGKDYIDPTRYRIMGRDLGRYQNWGYSAYVPRHAAQHEFNPKGPGGDIVWTYKQQIVPLLVHPSGTQGAPNVVIEPDLYYYYDRWIYAGGTGTPSLLTCKPSGGGNARMALVQLDKDGNPIVTCGDTEFPESVTGSANVSPYIPGLVDSMNIPLAAVRLVTGTSVILWRNIYDARGLVGQMTSTGTSSTPISGHIIAQDGVGVTQRPILNFEGPIVFVSDDPLNDRTDIVISGASGHVIQDDGANRVQRTNLNFVGDTFVVYDDNTNDATIVSGTASGVSGAPDDAEYLTLALNGTLSDERVFTPGDGLAGTDGGAGSTYTLDVDISPLGDIGTPDAGDLLIIEDITDGSIKRVNWSEIGGGVSNFVDLNDVDSPFGDDEVLYWGGSNVEGDAGFLWNDVNKSFCAGFILNNYASIYSAIFGVFNNVTGTVNIVGGGGINVKGTYNVAFSSNSLISGSYSVVAGGNANKIYQATEGSILGGLQNILDSGANWSSILGGANNKISSQYSAVFGRKARALHDGTVLFTDSANKYFDSIKQDEFAARFDGGFRFVTETDASGNPTHTVQILPTGTLYTEDLIVSGTSTFYNQIELEESGRVKRDIWINVDGFQSPGIKPAQKVDYGIADAWEFTDGTDDTLYARVKLPDDMDKSVGMTINIGWSTPTANAGNCRWQVEYLFRQADEAMDAVADATLVDNFAASAVAKGLVVSQIGTTAVPNANDVCLTMRIKRRADEAGDTLGEDNHLYGLCIEYYSNKLGVAV